MSELSSKTAAQSIANDLGLSGSYWPAIIQALIGLSQPSRQALENYLQSQLVYYSQTRDAVNYLSQKGDIVSNQINSLVTILTTITQPLLSFLRTYPIDSALKAIPEFSEMLGGLSNNVPLKIPYNISTQITGLAGFDLLDGVSSFQDLNDKLDEMIFRAARATALSNYAVQSTFIIDSEVDKINSLINILETLRYRNF